MSYTLNVNMAKAGAAQNAMLNLINKFKTMSTVQDIMARWQQEYPRSYLSKRGSHGICDWQEISFFTEQDAVIFLLRYS